MWEGHLEEISGHSDATTKITEQNSHLNNARFALYRLVRMIRAEDKLSDIAFIVSYPYLESLLFPVLSGNI